MIVLNIQTKDQNINTMIKRWRSDAAVFLNSYLYITDAKSFFDVPREKLSPGSFRPRQAISRSSKDFTATVYTTLCVQPKICNYKMNT
jgi:hypothetical protein